MKNERIAVYIDGGNTYRRLKNLGIPQKSSRFDYSAFVEHLVGDRSLISKRHYVGIVKNIDGSEKSEKMVKSQQKIVDEIKGELNKQEEINKKIQTERNEIDEIIEKAIK